VVYIKGHNLVMTVAQRETQAQKHFYIPAYIRCRTCGKYIPQSEAKPGGFCSDVCTGKFNRCITCGKYFPSNEGYRKIYCSTECAVQYRIEYPTGDRETLQIMEVKE